MPHTDDVVRDVMAHIRYLSETIGGRGSCTPAERLAAEYAAEQMRGLGVQDVRLEPYRGAPSTYRPYALAFGAALLGTLLVWVVGGTWPTLLAILLMALGCGGMLAETDFTANWMRRLLPTAGSQNVVGVIPAAGEVRRRAILCAHLDTHRTPVFYSSLTWNKLFGALVGGALVSMVVGGAAYGLAAAFGWTVLRWLGLVAAAIQLFALALCLHADLTPFSPGANDDASGVGLALALARRLCAAPLAHTEVWLALTGCEETAAYGMAAFLDGHAASLGQDAVYVVLDEVGLGRLIYLTADGLIVKRPTHPQALALARRARAALPDLAVEERVGIAYTDAAVATKRGLIALTLVAHTLPGSGEPMHWHQMSDTIEYVAGEALATAYTFTWQVLQEVEPI